MSHDDEFRLHTPEFRPLNEKLDRRQFLTKTSLGLGALAVGSLLGCRKEFGPKSTIAPGELSEDSQEAVLRALPHFAPKAKRVVYLFMSGGPSQFETFDYKPKLNALFGQDLPDSVRQGQRLTGMSANQSSLPIAPSVFTFDRYGKSGTWVSELLPYTAKVVDDICVIKSLYTEQINHDPAITFFQTGNQLPGRPSIGSWVSYGLGSSNENLPTFISLISKKWQWPTPVLTVVGERVFAHEVRRRAVSLGQRPRAFPEQPRRLRWRRPEGNADLPQTT